MRPKSTYLFRNTARLSAIVPGFFLFLFCAGCAPKKTHQVQTAFYYWKTNLRIAPYESKVLQETGTEALYLRLFDIDWNEAGNKPVPVGILQSEPVMDTTLQYIPVVYITQPCLLRLEEKDLPGLAANVSGLMRQLCDRYHVSPAEIQIDCDWTKNSSALYFRLLQHLKEQDFFRDKLLSCTIRLHQVKYTSANGIPPVDKGLLMVYNMGNLTRYGGHNSILEPGEAIQYLKGLGTYPLPLDVALPLYHWAALFEQKRFKGILYNLGKEQFAATGLEHKEGNLYRIKTDSKTGGYSLKAGQEIRFEAPGLKDLEQVAAFIGSRIKDSTFRLAFFHLDSLSMQPYRPADLNHIRSTF